MIDELESAHVGYMLVGSLSSNYYGIPRATEDADFVVQLGASEISRLAAKLGQQFQFDPQMSFETSTVTRRHQFLVRDTAFKIEFFLLSDDPHDQQRFQRRRRVALVDRQTWVPTAEDVIVMKLRWIESGSRNKDIDDVRNVIAVQGQRIDWSYVHHWCAQHGTRGHLDSIRATIENQ
ncbi:MAG: hypothetical protein K8T25_06450 [Planctomycetia bacterium]|nr:hypothetical protein [Planctomycetia bacterium]